MKMGEAGRTVNLAIIGLGGRGIGQMKTLLQMPDVKVRVVCDVYADRIEKAQQEAEAIQGFRPAGEQDYRKAICREDVEACVVMTSWTTHIAICIAAMKAGKHAAMEVGGAGSVDECWRKLLLQRPGNGASEHGAPRRVRRGDPLRRGL